ncbi:MAG: NUDIX hydrolase, partial [Phycisphaerales bacterium]|nr:NUDIX hydrolase [Phycisphaerales bacterium]
EQFRPPVNGRVLELPAGLVGDEEAGEASLDAARRELLEETGYVSNQWCHIGTGLSSSGLSDESLDILVALDARKEGRGGGVADEQIDVVLAPLNQLHELLEAHTASGGRLDLKILLSREAISMARASLSAQ